MPGPSSVDATLLVRGYGTGAARTPVLRGLSISFRPGELTLVMGASGSGKSTLLAVLGGLLRPESGRVMVGDTDIWSLPPRELERFRFANYGFVFQGFNLFTALSARDQVALPMRFAGASERDARARAEAALAEVDLADKAASRPAELSGGEKQRVSIARALVGRPSVLFADEPTSALDSVNGGRVVALLREVALEHGSTVIAVTHDPRLARHADRIVELCDGAVIRDASAAKAGLHGAIEAVR